MKREVVFPGPDIGYLRSAAGEIGLEPQVPHDIREAQALKDSGVPVPGDLDPEEAYRLQEIADSISAGGPVPKGFTVYLNDRGLTDIPEADVPTVVFRQKRVALNKLTSAVDDLTSAL